MASNLYGSKQKSKPREEFNMSEDMFPALPTTGGKGAGGLGGNLGQKPSPSSSPRDAGAGEDDGALRAAGNRPGGAGGKPPQSPGRSPNARAQGARPGATLDANNRYGLLGLLNVIRTPDQDLKTLQLGIDLTTLGLNLNSPDVLFPSFQSPWADAPLPPKEPPFKLPPCYAVNAKLLPVHHRMAHMQLSDETLFYAFYSMPGDINQLAAAAALYERHWRYHKEQKVWITRAPGVDPTHRTSTYEQGKYIYFETSQWKKMTKEFRLQYDQLEERKQMPAAQAQ